MLLDKYKNMIYKMCHNYGVPRMDMEDILSGTQLRVLKYNYVEQGSGAGYVSRACYSEIMDYWKIQKRIIHTKANFKPRASTIQNYEQSDLLNRVVQFAWDRFPWHAPWMEKKMVGWKIKELSEEFGVPAGTIKSAWLRFQKECHEEFKQERDSIFRS